MPGIVNKYSIADFASSVHSSRNMVQEVLQLSEALHIQWPLEDDVTNLDLEAILYPERHKKDENRLIHDATSVADNVTDHSNLNTDPE